MLGTQTQYPNQYPAEVAPAKGRSWRKPAIVVVLLALIGIGGWWVYQNNMAGQVQSTPGQMVNSSASAAAGQLPASGKNASVIAVEAQAPNTSMVASTGSATASQDAVQAAASGLKLASLAGVAEVAGTPVWNDDGTLLATLESGSILTVEARTSDGTWLSVATSAGSGWVQASTVIAYGLQNLAATTLPEAVAGAGTQLAPTAAADPSTTSADLSLADLVPSSSSAAGSQPAQAASVQLSAKIAATGSRLNVRSGPGTGYQVVAKAGDGTEYQAVGRSAAGDWVLLQLNADTGDVGWVSAGYVELSGDIRALPIENA